MFKAVFPGRGECLFAPAACVWWPSDLPAIRDFYTRLCRLGKPRKVALVAAMRKLLLNLNAVVRDQVPWHPDRMPMAGEA